MRKVEIKESEGTSGMKVRNACFSPFYRLSDVLGGKERKGKDGLYER